MGNEVVVVMDCGSTNASVIAVDSAGAIAASASRPNSPSPQPGCPEGYLIWDLDEVWGRLCDACREVCAQLAPETIRAVTVCTFGADGAPVKRDGSLTYPVICWQDARTEPLAASIGQRIDPWEIYAITGYQVIPFNTLLRLIWLRENVPQALDEADCFLMMPGVLSMRLCGGFAIDPTAAGTMMAMDIARRDWSEKMLSLAGVDPSLFPQWVEPGEVIGETTAQAAEQTGLPQGTPVVAAGHDTQFAAIGSGASPREAILSSGTWEILMLRHDRFEPNRAAFDEGVLVECDAVAGYYNPQLLMMGSAVLEWIREHFYAEVAERSEAYAKMIADAQGVAPGADGVMFLPCFVSSTGPTKKFGTKGTILGLELSTSPAQVYRAALEGLSFQMRHALDILRETTGAAPEAVRCVGGGSKNDLWNQIRADVCRLPIRTISQKEATVLGAAMFGFVGTGVFASIEQAQEQMAGSEATFEPSPEAERYEELYQRYRSLPQALERFYAGAEQA